jgi:hypothetical protein
VADALSGPATQRRPEHLAGKERKGFGSGQAFFRWPDARSIPLPGALVLDLRSARSQAGLLHDSVVSIGAVRFSCGRLGR